MERIRPTLRNKTEIPVNIYKGEELLIECPSIQQAAKFFKNILVRSVITGPLLIKAYGFMSHIP